MYDSGQTFLRRGDELTHHNIEPVIKEHSNSSRVAPNPNSSSNQDSASRNLQQMASSSVPFPSMPAQTERRN